MNPGDRPDEPVRGRDRSRAAPGVATALLALIVIASAAADLAARPSGARVADRSHLRLWTARAGLAGRVLGACPAAALPWQASFPAPVSASTTTGTLPLPVRAGSVGGAAAAAAALARSGRLDLPPPGRSRPVAGA